MRRPRLLVYAPRNFIYDNHEMPLTFESVKAAINRSLKAYFDEKITQAALIHPAYATLWHSMSDVALAGGKRFRPYLVVAAYGGLDETILPVATATELLHVAVLVHDDIIDRDDTRHGQPTLVKRYDEQYTDLKEPLERRHYANSAALLGGDLLLSEAHALLAASAFSGTIRAQASHILSQSVFEVAGGELLDTENSFVHPAHDPLLVNRYKTSSYSFIRPLQLGAVCAGHDTSVLAALETFGHHAGIAFQLQDDHLGVFGNETLTGKSASTDLQEGKRTYLVEQFYALASPAEQERFNQLFGQSDTNDADLTELRQLLTSSGADAKNLEMVTTHFTAARETLATLPLPTARDHLHQLLNALEERIA